MPKKPKAPGSLLPHPLAQLRATLGWTPSHTFESGLRQTVDWYVQNKAWWERVRSGAYQAYYQQQYGNR